MESDINLKEYLCWFIKVFEQYLFSVISFNLFHIYGVEIDPSLQVSYLNAIDYGFEITTNDPIWKLSIESIKSL